MPSYWIKTGTSYNTLYSNPDKLKDCNVKLNEKWTYYSHKYKRALCPQVRNTTDITEPDRETIQTHVTSVRQNAKINRRTEKPEHDQITIRAAANRMHSLLDEEPKEAEQNNLQGSGSDFRCTRNIGRFCLLLESVWSRPTVSAVSTLRRQQRFPFHMHDHPQPSLGGAPNTRKSRQAHRFSRLYRYRVYTANSCSIDVVHLWGSCDGQHIK